MKKFVKKHKTAIIIGAVIVVAAVTVVAVVAYSSTTAAAAAAGAVASGLHSEDDKIPTTEIPQDDSLQATEQAMPIPESLTLTEVFEEQIAPLRESLAQEAVIQEITFAESDGWSLAEKARLAGSCVAHEILDGLATLGAAVPELMSEIKEVGARFLPKNIPPLTDFNGEPLQDPIDRYNDFVQEMHETIDTVFDTDCARRYTPEAKANNLSNEFAVGVLPPPCLLSEITYDLKQLAEAGKALDRMGYTRAGRGLMKHGYRPDSVFPKPFGNPARVNVHGQSVLEEILAHPEKEIYKMPDGGIKIYVPDGRGARFKKNGTFMGFVEKQYE